MANEINRRRPGRKPPKKRPTGVIVAVVAAVIVLAFALAIGGIAWTFLKFYTPTLDTDTPFPIDTADPSDTDVTGDPSDTSSGDDNKYIRNQDIVNFLIIGQDLESWKTDVMMIVNFNL